MPFYVLNFRTHSFYSCDDADAVNLKIRELLESVQENELEIVTCCDYGVRYSVSEFRTVFD